MMKKSKKTIITKKRSSKVKIIKLSSRKFELLLLISTLINYYILLYYQDTLDIKFKIIDVLKKIRDSNQKHFITKDMNDKALEQIYTLIEQLSLHTITTIEKTNLKKSNLKGGFYFKSLEDKGENPITGQDLTKLLDEIQQFFYNAKYTAEGQHLQDTDTLLSMLRGDTNQFKAFLQYRIFPKYYTVFPPFIKWDGIKEAISTKKWEDIPDYLLAYQSYLRSRDEYDVERGLKPASVLEKGLYTGFYDKLAHSLDTNIQTFQRYRSQMQGNFVPLRLPV